MNVFKRVGALALALTMTAACLAGCSSSGDTSAPSSSTTVPESIELTEVNDLFETLSGIPTDTVVATAGDVEITAGQLLYWIAYGADGLYQYYSMYGLTEMPWDTTDEDGNSLADTLKSDALKSAAIYALAPVMAQKEGIELSEDFTTLVDSTMTQMTAAFGGEEIMNYYLWQYPLTIDTYVKMCESEEFNALLMDARFAEGGPDYPTDDEVLDYVNNELELYSVKHILLASMDTETREPLDEATVAQKKATAEDLVAQLRASDDPIALFDELMHEYSEDPGLAAYPDGYLANQKGQMVPEFEEASLALEVGEISDVVEAEGTGFHIILRLPLEVSAADYRETYTTQLMTDLQNSWLEENKVVTNENFDKIDPATYYSTLTVLRDSVTAKMEEITAELEAQESASGSASASASTSADASAAASSAQG